MDELHYLLNILLAVVLGFAIGYERKLRYKEAGIRTHTIVCAGSALMMVVSKYGFGGEDADASRVAAQIVAGVGFLGAGIIVYRKHEVHGLTTAAGVWATAGVGMAAGAGLYVIAAGATVILIGVQCLFHIRCKFFQTKKYFQVKIVFTSSGGENDVIKEIFQTDRLRNILRSGSRRLWRSIPSSAPSNAATRHNRTFYNRRKDYEQPSRLACGCGVL